MDNVVGIGSHSKGVSSPQIKAANLILSKSANMVYVHGWTIARKIVDADSTQSREGFLHHYDCENPLGEFISQFITSAITLCEIDPKDPILEAMGQVVAQTIFIARSAWAKADLPPKTIAVEFRGVRQLLELKIEVAAELANGQVYRFEKIGDFFIVG